MAEQKRNPNGNARKLLDEALDREAQRAAAAEEIGKGPGGRGFAADARSSLSGDEGGPASAALGETIPTGQGPLGTPMATDAELRTMRGLRRARRLRRGRRRQR